MTYAARHTTRRPSRRARAGRLVAAAGCVAAVLAPTGTGAAGTPTGAVSRTVTATRTHLVNGADQVVDTRTVTVDVDQTRNLRDRQEIDVRWTGAHPTGGVVGDWNSGLAAEQEYPVMVMQCRGVDSTSVPVAQRLSRETCWTQTPAERAQSEYTFPFPAFRLDRYATAADRKVRVGQPSPLPAACDATSAGVQHWVPFVGADGTNYPGGLFGCGGMPPESANRDAALQPGNTTYADTDLDGKGATTFVISTNDANASLGCSNTVPCSLVVIPIVGVSCDAAAAALPPADQPGDLAAAAFARCAATGKYQPGAPSSGGVHQEDLAVAGALWWAESNWRNRIAIPLTFAPPANVCDLANTSTPLYLYGSPLLIEASQQWSPRFCLDPRLFKVQHVQTGEPQARNLLEAGSIEAALVAGPPVAPYTRPVVHAPVALTGFAIAYLVDDRTGHRFHSLKMTPRLLAKLLTESYPSNATVRNEYPALHDNPLDMARDPEFRALNPGPPGLGYTTEPAATLFAMSSDSDVMAALTAYVDADPDARAWLDGAADPWGMVVNPKYRGIALPVISWPALDTFESPGLYRADANACLSSNPVPWLPLVAAPVSSLATITLNMQFGIANSQIRCVNPGDLNQKLTAIGRENPGQRFLVAVTSLADAARYKIDAAALLTRVAPGAATTFTDATGRTFVGPTDAALRSAAGLLAPDPKTGTWPVPYATLRTDARGVTAYPGTMLVSLDAPTSGIPKADAVRYAQWLDFVATSGQTPGYGNGQLPPGYVPLTAANGLGALAAYARTAAAAVAAQSGEVPPVVPRSGPVPAPSATAPAPVPTAAAPIPPAPVPSAPAPRVPAVGPLMHGDPPVPLPPRRPVVATGATADVRSGAAAAVLPALALLAFAVGAGALLTRLLGRRTAP